MFKRVFLFCCVLFVLLGMGIWQVQRFFYKQDLIRSLECSSQSTSILSNVAEITKKVNYKITVEGQFVPNQTLFWYRLQKNQIGYNLVVPFRMKDGVILVDLGWSKERHDVQVKPGTHVITGYLLEFFGPSKLIVDSDIKGRTWFKLDQDEIGKYLGYKINPVVIKVTDKKYLIGKGDFIPKKITNNHMYYAVMWLSLGVIWVIFMGIYHRNNKK